MPGGILLPCLMIMDYFGKCHTCLINEFSKRNLCNECKKRYERFVATRKRDKQKNIVISKNDEFDSSVFTFCGYLQSEKNNLNSAEQSNVDISSSAGLSPNLISQSTTNLSADLKSFDNDESSSVNLPASQQPSLIRDSQIVYCAPFSSASRPNDQITSNAVTSMYQTSCSSCQGKSKGFCNDCRKAYYRKAQEKNRSQEIAKKPIEIKEFIHCESCIGLSKRKLCLQCKKNYKKIQTHNYRLRKMF